MQERAGKNRRNSVINLFQGTCGARFKSHRAPFSNAPRISAMVSSLPAKIRR
jgi:hypothetical protein